MRKLRYPTPEKQIFPLPGILNHRATVLVLTVAAAGLLSQVASAELAVYTRAAEFESASGELLFEGFERWPTHVEFGERTVDFGPFRVTYAGEESFGTSDYVHVWTHVGPVSGWRYLRSDFAGTSDALVFEFDNPIKEFGAAIKDYELPYLGALKFATSNGDVGVGAAAQSSGTVQFLGIISDTPFASLAFAPEQDPQSSASWGDWVFFDDVSMSVSAVPEPGAVALWSLAGVLGAILAWRKRISV